MYDYLVCSPEHFEVTYNINPFMVPDEWSAYPDAYRLQAKTEWLNFTNKLCATDPDVTLHHLPSAPGIPDLVFTANGGSVLNKKVLLSKFKYTQRRPEEPYFLTMFQDLQKKGIIDEIVPFPEDMFFEGCGDCLWDSYRQVFWFGYGPRSQFEAAYIISDVFEVEVIPLELKTSVFYHLDTCFCPLTMGEIIIYPNAFTNTALGRIEEYVDWKSQAILPKEWYDVNKLAMNSVCIDKNIIMSRCSADLEVLLYDRGYNVIKTPLDTFLKSGGGPACLTLPLSFTI